MANKKDIIYIDIEDEITGIISKMKASKSKIVALVPPKRSTVLNSVVNLKLLKRASDDSGKNIVLITNERAIVSLAGGLDFFVAKNLHSKPEVPENTQAPEVDDSVIEGTEIDLSPEKPVGELEETYVQKKVDLTDLNEPKDEPGKPTEDKPKPKKKPDVAPISKKSMKVPNFESFRIRIILAVVGVLVLIGGWFWAFKIAPNAVINITAQTSRIDTIKELTVDNTVDSSDLEKSILKPQVQVIERTVSEQFDATGEKDVGNKATGTITIQNCRQSDPYEVIVGTQFTSPAGLVFETDATAVAPGATFVLGDCTAAGEVDVAVTAVEAGDDYNLAPIGYTSEVAGISGIGGQMSGGTTKLAQVVSGKDFEDVQKSIEDRDFAEVIGEIESLFEGEVIVINESFQVTFGKITSDPEVGEEAEKATASVKVSIRMMAVDRAELTQVIDEDVVNRISIDQQSIYESGIDNVRFTLDKRFGKNKIGVTLSTFTLVGPEVDTDQLAEDIAGKQFSEARALIEDLPGVRSVDIDFDPFWISRAPTANKITVSLEIAESTLQ